jgi:hypothetical protein
VSVGALAPPSVPPPCFHGAGSSASASRKALRMPLAAKLAAALIGLVTLVLLVNGRDQSLAQLHRGEERGGQRPTRESTGRGRTDRAVRRRDRRASLAGPPGRNGAASRSNSSATTSSACLRQSPAVTEVSYLDPFGQGTAEGLAARARRGWERQGSRRRAAVQAGHRG